MKSNICRRVFCIGSASALAAAPIASLFSGCDVADNRASEVEVPPDNKIRQQLDEVLDFTYRRELKLRDHAAWQILHGVLAFGREFRVRHNGESVYAVEYMLGGGQMRGWDVQVVVNPESGYRGLHARLAQGSASGQGHYDQWFAVLAQCDLPPDETTIQVGNETVTMTDFLRQIQWEVPRNLDREFSWTLIGLTTYLQSSASWTAVDGAEWSIARLVGYEAEPPIGEGACGGTHRLIGLTMAVNRHLGQGGKLVGPWKKADERIQDAIRRARKFQNPDGSFSPHYLVRSGTSPDIKQNLRNTGHVLEFLALSMTDAQLRQPWVKRSIVNLCELFDKTRHLALECGALYHAAHGLVLYRERVFGERTFDERKEKTNSTSANVV